MSDLITQGDLAYFDIGDRIIGIHIEDTEEEGKCALIASRIGASDARRLAAWWNACAGFDTELLENIDMFGDTLKQRFEGMQAEVRRVDTDARAIKENHEAARALLSEAMGVVDGVPSTFGVELAERIRAFLKGGA